MGHSEPSIELFSRFRTVNTGGATLYQKSEGAVEPPPARVPVTPARCEVPVIVAAPPPRPVRETPAIASPPAPAECRAEASEERLAEIRELADRGECEKALRIVGTLQEKHRLDPTVHFYQALVLEQMGDHARNERSLRQAIYLDRSFVLAHFYLGMCLARKREAREAARTFRNVIKIVSGVEAFTIMPHGDGITAGDLRELAEMNLEVLGNHE